MKNLNPQTCGDCGATLDEQGMCPNGCNTDDYGLCDLDPCEQDLTDDICPCGDPDCNRPWGHEEVGHGN